MRIFVVILFFSISAHAGLWNDVNQSLIQKNWAMADLQLDELSSQNVSDRERYNILLNQSWVKLNLGLTGEAKNLLTQIDRLTYEPTELEALTLHDTSLMVKYHHITSLPPIENRIIIDSSDNRLIDRANLYSAFSAASWTSKKIDEFLKVKKDTSPFLKPMPPKLIRGEFEKPDDFIARVEIAQNQYKQAMELFYDSEQQKKSDLQREINQRRSYLPTLSRLYTQAAIRKTIGQPEFNLVKYNAITEYFPGRIIPSQQTDLFKGITIASDEPIETARDIKPLLKMAKPVLVFTFNNQEIQLSNVLLELPDHKIIEVRLIEDSVDQQFASYQVPEIEYSELDSTGLSTAASVVEGKTEVLLKSIDPEIKRLKNALVNAELANNQAAISRLKKDIQQFESTLQQSFDDDLKVLLAKVKPVQENPNYYAVVVGINKYAKTINVDYADRSAQLFTQVLNKVLGVPKANIVALYNEEATSGNIKTRLKYRGSKIRKTDRLFFFYAGHGIPSPINNGEPYLLAHDMDAGYASFDEDMKLTSIWQALTSSGQGEVIAFMDSCFSGKTDNRSVYEGIAPGLLKRAKFDHFSADNLLVFTAGNEHQFASYYPEKGHRLFSYFLLKGLMKGYRKPNDLYLYVSRNVANKSSMRGPDYEQTPQMNGKIIEKF